MGKWTRWGRKGRVEAGGGGWVQVGAGEGGWGWERCIPISGQIVRFLFGSLSKTVLCMCDALGILCLASTKIMNLYLTLQWQLLPEFPSF